MTAPGSANSPDRERLRRTFDAAAERYDRRRPEYPAALFDDLAAHTGIGAGSRVLEIGLGTGQASIPLARRGCRLVGVELGPHLATIARRNLAACQAVDGTPAAEVIVAAFEEWPLPAEPFDLVLAATCRGIGSTPRSAWPRRPTRCGPVGCLR